MTYKPTILNVSTGLFLIGVILYSVFNYSTLSKDESTGLLTMAGLAGAGVFAAMMDLLLQALIRDNKTLQIVSLVILLCVASTFLVGI